MRVDDQEKALRFCEMSSALSRKWNGALIRYDILCATRSLFEATKDQAIKSQASALIASETDDKYRKKYARAWRGLLT